MANIIKTMPSESEKILHAAYNNLITFGKLFLKGDFGKSNTPFFHYEIGEELLSPSNKPCAIIISRGHGKYLRLDQPVLTTNGWTPVSNLKYGDMIYGSDGKPKQIIGFSDIIYKDDMYKVSTRDSRSLVVSGDHLWTVKALNGYRNPSKYKTVDTTWLINKYKSDRFDPRYKTNRIDYNFGIENPKPIELDYKDLEIDPYTLGVVLGDGSVSSSSTPRITLSISDINEIVSYIPYETNIRYPKDKTPYFSILKIYDKIRSLGLNNKNSYNKFIPKKYLESSVDQRIELLRGLMDTDGCLSTETSRGKRVYYCTASEVLANDFVYLVRSLGGTATKTFHDNEYNGYYNISIAIEFNPFKLKRKSSRFVPHDKLFNAITNIEKVDGAFCRCIKVDSEDELFVANDFLLTHNTTLIKAAILHDLVFAKKAKEWGFADKERDLFFGWVSSSQKKSRNNIAYIKLNLEYNERINHYFSPKDKLSLRGDTWNAEDLITAYGDRLISSSNLTSMRGDTLATIKSGAVRYSRVFVDDAENEGNTKTQNSRESLVDNIMNGILPAIEKNEPGCRLFLVETPVHWDSFAQQILDRWDKVQKEGQEAIDQFSWKVITYGATQSNMPGGVLWDGWLSKDKLDEIKQMYQDSPRGVEGYFQEYELKVQSDENSLWTRKHIKYWDGYYTKTEGVNYLVIDGNLIPVNTFIGCDPATDIETKNSDYSVIQVVAVDKSDNAYVIDYERHRSIPTLGLRDADGEIDGKAGVVDHIIRLYDKYNCSMGVVEDVAMTRSVFQSLNAERKRLNRWDINIVPEKPGGEHKINRIYSGLNGRFSAGKIFLRENQFDLINEIIKFGPKMSHDDTIEALYYALKRAYPPSNLSSKPEMETGLYRKHTKRRPKPWTIA